MYNITLRVKDALKIDHGKGIVRIDPEIVDKLNLKNGNIIEIFYHISNKKTVGRLHPGIEEDRGSNIIHMEDSLRKSIDVSIDHFVGIRKIYPVVAEKVFFYYNSREPMSGFLFSPQIENDLNNRVISMGKIIRIYEINHSFEIEVLDYFPRKNAVIINEGTNIIFTDNPNDVFKASALEKVTENTNESFIDNETIINLKKIARNTNSIQLEELRGILNIPKNVFDNRIYEWAKQFGFRIEGEFLIFKDIDILELEDRLKKSFDDWGKKEKNEHDKK